MSGSNKPQKIMPGVFLEKDEGETRAQYEMLKECESEGNELIKFSSLSLNHPRSNRLDNSATNDAEAAAVIIVDKSKSAGSIKMPPLQSSLYICNSVTGMNGAVATTATTAPSCRPPPPKVPRTGDHSQGSTQQQPFERSLTTILSGAHGDWVQRVREHQQACQTSAIALQQALARVQARLSQKRPQHPQHPQPQSPKTEYSEANSRKLGNEWKTKGWGPCGSELTPSSAQRMATLRGLYRDGKLRAVAASHDFIGGLVDLKFEPTGRYPVILGASAYGKGEDDERLHVNATAAHTGTAIMYNYRTGAMTTHRAHGLNTVTEVDFLRDGSMGFTAGYDGNVFAWKTNSFDAAPERLQILRSHKSVSVERLQASKYFDVIACAANNKQKGDKTVDETKGEIVVVSFTTSRSSFSAFSAPPSSSSSSSSADAMEDPDAMDDDSDMDYDGTSEIGASFIRGNGGSNSNGEGKFEVLHPFESHKFACNDLTFGCVGYESWLMCACKNGTVMANDITCCSGGGSGGDKAMIVFESWVPVSALACAARTQLGAFGTEDGVVRTWDPRAPGAIATTPSLGADFNCMSFDPTDTLLQCSAMNSAVYIFDVRKVGVPLRVLRHNPPGGKSSCGVPMSRWSPAGFLFSCGDDSTLRIWDLAAGDPLLRTIRTHSDSVSCMAISPDESLVVSGDDSKRVVLHSFLPKRGNADIDEDTELDDAKYDRFAGAVGPIKV